MRAQKELASMLTLMVMSVDAYFNDRIQLAPLMMILAWI